MERKKGRPTKDPSLKAVPKQFRLKQEVALILAAWAEVSKSPGGKANQTLIVQNLIEKGYEELDAHKKERIQKQIDIWNEIS